LSIRREGFVFKGEGMVLCEEVVKLLLDTLGRNMSCAKKNIPKKMEKFERHK
jgi:hypothetical protein